MANGARPTFESLARNPGFLTDRVIRAALDADYLLERGSWDLGQVRHASYTLRLGDRVEVARYEDRQRAQRQRVAITLNEGGDSLQLRPGDTALLYSLESLRLPACVLGFTVARGLLFVEGLSPENTYIDPGFTGPIYTTVTNVSDRIFELDYGTPIARLFFYRLVEDVAEEYRRGAAKGIEQHLPSQPGVAFATVDAARAASTSALITDLETSDRGGFRTGQILRRQATIAQAALLTAIVLPVLLQVATSWTWLRDRLGGDFAASVLASLVAAGIVFGTQKVWNRVTQR